MAFVRLPHSRRNAISAAVFRKLPPWSTGPVPLPEGLAGRGEGRP